MDRVPKMIDLLAEEIANVGHQYKQRLKEMNVSPIQEKVLQVAKQLTTEQERSLVVSYLRSSYITGSHKFKIAAYSDEPFVNITPFYDYFKLPDDLIPWERDRGHLVRELERLFFRLMKSEVEEIRRWYMETLYQESRILFQRAVEQLNNHMSATNVFFGEEMGQLDLIGVIE